MRWLIFGMAWTLASIVAGLVIGRIVTVRRVQHLEKQASIERAKRAQARERVEFVQAVGGDVIGVDDDGRIQWAASRRPERRSR